MAKITHNVSTPNDGLGDALRTSFVNQNSMNTELYDNKVDKIDGLGLSENDFTDALLTKLNNLNGLDLSYMPNPSEGQIVDNNGGTGLILPLADAVNAGLMSPADFVKAQTVPTLQQVLDNNHDLVNGNNFQGTGAGVNNIGNNVNGNGEDSAGNNTGSNVNANGKSSGRSNTFNNVNLFGLGSQADADNQTVFAIDGADQARISFADITGFKKFDLINESGSLTVQTYKEGDFTAVNGASYVVRNATITDPTGVQGQGYKVYVYGGTATIDGITYLEFSLIYRYYDGSIWQSTLINKKSNEEYKTNDFTAENGGFYVTGDSGAVTVTDPTGVVGEGYTVFNPHYAIIIGGVTYGPGCYVLRRFITGGWVSFDLSNTAQIIAINQSLATKFDSLRGDFSATATAQTSFTITFGGTQPNNTYFVGVTARNALTAAQNYVMTKTTTTFTVTFLTGLTGTVNFDWVLHQ